MDSSNNDKPTSQADSFIKKYPLLIPAAIVAIVVYSVSSIVSDSPQVPTDKAKESAHPVTESPETPPTLVSQNKAPEPTEAPQKTTNTLAENKKKNKNRTKPKQNTKKAAKVEEPAKNSIDPKTQSYLETYGWLIGQRIGIDKIHLSKEEMDVFIKGLKHAFRKEQSTHDVLDVRNDMNKYLTDRAALYADSKNKETRRPPARDAWAHESREYFAKLRNTNPEVQTTDSGLHYEILKPGSSKKPGSNDTVVVHYEGFLINGTKFDSSVDRGEPATFPVNQLISGWTEGLCLMGEGGKAKFHIPADLAYGYGNSPFGIPPGSTLIFDVVLLEIK